MKNLLAEYGYCIIPPKTLLYRSHIEKNYNECMFFATTYSIAKAFGKNVQIWMTTKEIQLIFLISHIDDQSRSSSNIPQLYNKIFPEDSYLNLDDLDIKQRDFNRRYKFINKLYKIHEINGWFSSLEDSVPVEVCLFDKIANSQQLKLLEIASDGTKYFKESLKRIKVYPTEKFYSSTFQKLDEMYPSSHSKADYLRIHQKSRSAWIKDDIDNGIPRIVSLHNTYDLRCKLKI